MTLNAQDFKNKFKKKIKLDRKHLVGLGLGFFITLGLLALSYYTIFSVLWIIVLPMILYLFPRLFGVNRLKVMASHGAVFFITALFIGVLFSAPAFIESNVELKDNGMFSNTNVIATDTGYTITTEYTGDDSSLTPMVRVLEMFGVGFYIEFGASGGLRDLSGSMDSSGKIEFDIPADDSIYTVLMYMKNSDGDIEPGSETNKIFLKDLASESKIDKAMWIGIGYMLIVIAVLYFMILFSTYLIRSRVNKTRD